MDSNQVTANQAIAKGMRIGYFSLFLFLFLIAANTIYIFTPDMSLVWAGLGFIATFIISFAYAVIAGTNWWIWALTHVSNVHELRRKAILAMLLPDEDSPWWKFHIKTQKQKQLLDELAKKFDTPEEFNDNPNIPNESVFYYLKSILVFEWLCVAASFGLSIYGFLMPGGIALGCASLAMALFLAYHYSKKIGVTEPILTISDLGITTRSYGFSDWAQIKNERVHLTRGPHLLHEKEDKTVVVNLSEIGCKNMNDLLTIYRGRANAANKK